MLSRSRHKDEAWELVKWMTGKEYQRQTAITLQIFPSRKSVANSGAYLYLDAPPKNRRVFVDMIKYGRTLPPVSCGPEMAQLIASDLDLVWLGRESAEEGCRKLVPRVNQLLRHRD
jgi:ABC-type glycerol-3-phosphate transport system substrate-binding protein